MKLFQKAAFLLLLTFISACSSSPVHDRTAGDWQVMTFAPGKNNALCYAGSGPIESTGTAAKRDQPYLMVTRRASGKIEISTSSGYNYMPSSKVELIADNKSYHLFFRTDTAWARNDETDKTILTAMKQVPKVQVRGVSVDGLTSIDTYSTRGFNLALNRIKELCP